MENGIRKYSEEKNMKSRIEYEVWDVTVDDSEDGIIDYYCIIDGYDKESGRIELLVVN